MGRAWLTAKETEREVVGWWTDELNWVGMRQEHGVTLVHLTQVAQTALVETRQVAMRQEPRLQESLVELVQMKREAMLETREAMLETRQEAMQGKQGEREPQVQLGLIQQEQTVTAAGMRWSLFQCCSRQSHLY
jgi:hypothetical protein